MNVEIRIFSGVKVCERTKCIVNLQRGSRRLINTRGHSEKEKKNICMDKSEIKVEERRLTRMRIKGDYV